MALIAKETAGGGFDPVPEGVHHAVCYGVYDLGTHINEMFGKAERKVLICWEIPEERIELEGKDGKMRNLPRGVSKKYTLSLGKKANLRKDLESWRNKAFTAEELAGFDLEKLLKVNCMIQIVHQSKDDKVFANVNTVMPLYKGIAKKEPENSVKFFSFEDAEVAEIPEDTPEWTAKLIRESSEWARMFSKPSGGNGQADGPPDMPDFMKGGPATGPAPAPDDDVPF